MRKSVFLAILLSVIMILPLSVNAETLGTLSNDDGNVSIIGFTTAEDKDGVTNFVALLQYENTTEESAAPWLNYNIKAYQDGIELETGYIYNFSFENYKSGDTNIRPGATLKYYKIFIMESNSPVDLEVAPMFNFDNEHIEYTFDLSEEMIATSSSGDSNKESNTSSVAQKIAELEQRIADLELRVSELEG